MLSSRVPESSCWVPSIFSRFSVSPCFIIAVSDGNLNVQSPYRMRLSKPKKNLCRKPSCALCQRSWLKVSSSPRLCWMLKCFRLIWCLLSRALISSLWYWLTGSSSKIPSTFTLDLFQSWDFSLPLPASPPPWLPLCCWQLLFPSPCQAPASALLAACPVLFLTVRAFFPFTLRVSTTFAACTDLICYYSRLYIRYNAIVFTIILTVSRNWKRALFTLSASSPWMLPLRAQGEV